MAEVPTIPGRAIVWTAWGSVALSALVSVPVLLGADALERVAAIVSLALFLLSLPVWGYAFFAAVGRTARGDDVAVASLFFLQGSAPAVVRRSLLGACAASIVVATVTAWANPPSVLVPMLPLGLTGMWGARYGTYPPRRPAATRRGA